MAAVNPLYASFFRPWTVWSNPLTCAPSNFVKVLPFDKVTRATRGIFDNDYIKAMVDNRAVHVVVSIIAFGYSNPLTRFIYALAERIFNSTAVLRSLSDIDSLTKTVTLITSFSSLWLGLKHPFVANLELGNKALGGFIIAKHFVAFSDIKKNYLDKLITKDGHLRFGNITDNEGKLKSSEICKTIGLIFFQFAHLCQTHEYMKRIGLFHILSETRVIGWVGKACLRLELGPLKNPVVVVAAIFATSSVGEWAIEKVYNSVYASGQTFWDAIKTFNYKPEEEVELVANFINNSTKAYIVAIQVGWAKVMEPLTRISGDWLGWTNLFKGAGYLQKADDDALAISARNAEIYTRYSQSTPNAPSVVRARKEDLTRYRFIR